MRALAWWERGKGWVLVASLVTGPAFAQQETVAESLFREGREAMRDHNPSLACPKFAESYRLDPSAGTLLNLALCEEALGHVATAWAKLRALLDTTPASDTRRDFARKRIAELEPRVPRVRITLTASTPPDALVRLDGVDLRGASIGSAIALDPGPHTVTLLTSAGTSSSRQFELTESQTLQLEVGATEPPKGATPPPVSRFIPAQPQSQAAEPQYETSRAHAAALRRAGYVAGALGGAGLVASIVFGSLALGQKSIVDSHCPDRVCDAEGHHAMEAGRTLVALANVGLTVGITGGVTAIALVLTSIRVQPVTGAAKGVSLSYAGTLP